MRKNKDEQQQALTAIPGELNGALRGLNLQNHGLLVKTALAEVLLHGEIRIISKLLP